MVHRIDRIYRSYSDRPTDNDRDKQLPAVREDEDLEREDGRVRRENIAERIAPHLHDKVELSDKARAAVAAEETDEVGHVSRYHDEAMVMRDSWLRAGIQQAYETLDQQD